MRTVFQSYNGYNLDEIKSCLQKSLRRKEVELAIWCAIEWGLNEKGQKRNITPDKFITLLGEDHCFAPNDFVLKIAKLMESKSKFNAKWATKLLLTVKSCRMSCLFPAYYMDKNGVGVAKTETDFEDLKAAVIAGYKEGGKAWEDAAFRALCYITQKGFSCNGKGKGKHGWYTHYLTNLITAICEVETDSIKKSVLKAWRYMAEVPGSTQSLIWMAIIVRRMFPELIEKSVNEDKDFRKRLIAAVIAPHENNRDLPEWCFDKHTDRGCLGTDTMKTFRKNQELGLFNSNKVFTEEFIQRHHGSRPKVNVNDFMETGIVEADGVTDMWIEEAKRYYKNNPSPKKVMMADATYYTEPSTSSRKRKSDTLKEVKAKKVKCGGVVPAGWLFPVNDVTNMFMGNI